MHMHEHNNLYRVRLMNRRKAIGVSWRKQISNKNLSLDSEPPSQILIALPLPFKDLRAFSGGNLISLPVDLTQQPPQSRHNHKVTDQVCKRHTMPNNILWRICPSIQLRTNHRSQISNRNLQSIRRRPFRLTRNIHRRPRQTQRHRRINPCSGEEDSDVGLSGTGCRRGVGEEENVAEDGGGGGEENEGGAQFVAFRDEGVADCEDCGEGVGWDGEELGFPGGVAEGGDDGWLGTKLAWKVIVSRGGLLTKKSDRV
jgi:hypothetical protein